MGTGKQDIDDQNHFLSLLQETNMPYTDAGPFNKKTNLALFCQKKISFINFVTRPAHVMYAFKNVMHVRLWVLIYLVVTCQCISFHLIKKNKTLSKRTKKGRGFGKKHFKSNDSQQ